MKLCLNHSMTKQLKNAFQDHPHPDMDYQLKQKCLNQKGKFDLLPVNTKYKNTMLYDDDKIRSSVKKSIKLTKKN